MADRPIEKKETAKKDEAYQPLWDTDQSVPEYMTLLMDQQTQKNEDATLHQASDNEDEELEHPDPDYEYVYPGAPKRYDSARKTLMTPTTMTPTTSKSRKTTHQKIPRKTLTNPRKDDDANHPGSARLHSAPLSPLSPLGPPSLYSLPVSGRRQCRLKRRTHTVNMFG